MRFPRPLQVAALSLFAVACTPAPPAASPPPLAPAAAANAVQPQPDLSPVAEPAGVILLMRARNLSDTLQAADSILHLPAPLQALARDALREQNLDVFKMNASVDAVLVLDPASTDDDPKLMGAASLPLSDLERAREAMQQAGAEFQLLVPGVYRGEVVHKSDLDTLEDQNADQKPRRKTVHCDLAASVGAAPARAVCANSVDELNALRPWMTRGLPTLQPSPEDFWLEARLAPARDRYLPVMRAQTAGLEMLASQWLSREFDIHDPVLLRVPGQLIEEGMLLIDDLDRVTLAADLDAAGPHAVFRGEASFRSKSAWVSRVWTEPNEHGGPPPELFWRLPRHVSAATYGRSADPKHFEPILATVRRAAGALLSNTPLSAGSRAALDSFLATVPLHGGTFVSAQGLVPTNAPSGADQPPRSPHGVIQNAEDLVQQSTGWSIVGVEAPASSYIVWLEKGAAMVDRLVRDARADKDLGPELRNANWIPKLRLRKGIPGYPAGAAALDVTVEFDSRDVWNLAALREADEQQPAEHPKGPAAKGSITARFVVVPDGQNRCWIGFSAHEPTLRANLRIVTTQGKPGDTLAEVAGLDALRASSAPSGGFIKYGDALQSGLRTMKQQVSEQARAKLDRALATLPNRLQTPVLLLGGGKAGPAPTYGLSVHVQAGTLEDIAAMVRYALSEEGRSLLESFGKARNEPADSH